MAAPARVWLTGFGSRLVPRPPFEVARLSGGERIVLAHHAAGGVFQVMVAPDPSSTDPTTARLALGPNTRSPSDCLDFIEVDEFSPGWRLVTRDYSCAFAHGLTLWSTPQDVSWPFELTVSTDRDRDKMIYVQGPWRPSEAPELPALIGPGMQMMNRSKPSEQRNRSEWIEIVYHHDGRDWAQRRYRVAVAPDAIVLITAQDLAGRADFAAADEVAASVAPRSFGAPRARTE